MLLVLHKKWAESAERKSKWKIRFLPLFTQTDLLLHTLNCKHLRNNNKCTFSYIKHFLKNTWAKIYLTFSFWIFRFSSFFTKLLGNNHPHPPLSFQKKKKAIYIRLSFVRTMLNHFIKIKYEPNTISRKIYGRRMKIE